MFDIENNMYDELQEYKDSFRDSQFMLNNAKQNSNERSSNIIKQSGSTLGSLLGYNLGQSSMDNFITNKIAKTNPLSFNHMLETGIYKNNTMLGGNGLFGSSAIDSIPGLRNVKKFIVKGGENHFNLGKLSFISAKELEKNGISDSVAKEYGLNSADEIIQSGFGYSKSHKEFANSLKDLAGGKKISFTGKELTKDSLVDHLLKETNLNSQTISSPENAKKLEKLGEEFYKISGNKKYKNMSKAIKNENYAFGLMDDIAKHFTFKNTNLSKSALKAGKLISGVGVGLVANLGVAAVTGAISYAAVSQQEKAIENYATLNLRRSDYRKDRISTEAYSTSYSHKELSYSNDIDYNSILREATNNKASMLANNYDTLSYELKSSTKSFMMYK